jgi:drug/metabolite transporter (DMT)-like permease
MNTRERKCAVFRIFLRAFIGSAATVFQFYSLKYISPADSSVILYCNPVFVAFGARIFLKEKVSICQAITALLAIAGVVIISKPPFLTGGGFRTEQLYGIIFAICAMFTVTAAVLLVRSLRGVHFSLLNSVFGITGMITGTILGLATMDLFKHLETEPLDYVILLGIGLLSFGGIVCTTLALAYEQAGPVAVVRSSEVIFSFFWQLLSSIYPDALSLCGAALVMTTILLTGFYRYVAGLEPSHRIRRWFSFVLK